MSCQDHCRGLAARGHDVTILSTDYGVKDDLVPSSEDILPVKRVLLCGDSGAFTIDFRNNYWRSEVIRFYIARRNYQITKKIIKELKPDIVYAFQLIEATFTPIVAAHRASVPVILNVGDDSYAKKIRYFNKKKITVINMFLLFRRMLAFGMFRLQPSAISHFLPNSERTNDALFDAGVQRSQCSVIPRYLRNENFARSSRELLAPKPLMSNQLKIVYGGRICEEKGIEAFVEIIRRLRQRGVSENIQVDLYGSGDNAYEKAIISLVQQNGLERIISFYPCMEQHDFLELLREYHIFLFPFQWEEPFGNVVTQSMASGVVCVASDKGGPAEIITHLQTGCLCKQRSVDDFVKNIELLASNQDLFDAIRNRAFQEVNEKYSAAAIVPKLEKLLREFALPGASS